MNGNVIPLHRIVKATKDARAVAPEVLAKPDTEVSEYRWIIIGALYAIALVIGVLTGVAGW